jgi:uncharacterized protein
MTRVLGYLGGYLWSHKVISPHSASINVHLYTSASLKFSVAGREVQLTQSTDWPWSGDVEFEINGSTDVDVTVRLRIPQWADSFEVSDHTPYHSTWLTGALPQISPDPPSLALEKGYLVLPPEYLAQNPKFHLSIPMGPRLISPHPFTNQPIAAVARGPIVYCVEDADHPWIDDHFKSVVFDTSVALTESVADCLPSSKEKDVAITAVDAARVLQVPKMDGPFADAAALPLRVDPERRETLRFVPYYAHANRGGKGMMRVGLRVG